MKLKIDTDWAEFKNKEAAQKWKEEFNEVVGYVIGRIELLIHDLPEKNV